MAKNWPAEKSSWEVRLSQRGFYFSSSASPTDFVLAARSLPPPIITLPRVGHAPHGKRAENVRTFTRETRQRERMRVYP